MIYMFFSLNPSISFYSWISLYTVGVFCSSKVWESSSMKPCRSSPYVSPRRKSLITTEVSSVNIRYISFIFLCVVYVAFDYSIQIYPLSLGFKIWHIAIYKILYFKCVMSHLFFFILCLIYLHFLSPNWSCKLFCLSKK